MRSRYVLVAAAWLLGVLTATAGSFLAVNGIAHGLLGTGPQPVAITAIQGDLATHHPSGGEPGAALSPPAAGDDGDQDTGTHQPQPVATATLVATPSASANSGGSLVDSPGGTVMASCQSGLAYLQYWSPNAGYQADDVMRGPAPQASIGFEQLSSEFEIRVTCNGSHPVASVTSG
jgi:serine/threonine-protein kinase